MRGWPWHCFIYPLVPCKEQLCSLSRIQRAILDWADVGKVRSRYSNMKKNKSREKRSGRRGSEHAY